jgi:hypothetical protein
VAEKDYRRLIILNPKDTMSIDFNRDILKDPERIAKMIYDRWKEKLLRIQRNR